MSQPEAQLKREIMSALKKAGYFAFRNEQLNHGKYKGGCGTGSPDIFVVLRPHGTLVGLEIKMRGKLATEEQIAWGRVLEAHGGQSLLACSVEEAVMLVRESSLRCWRRG